MGGLGIHPLIWWPLTLSTEFSHRAGKFSTILPGCVAANSRLLFWPSACKRSNVTSMSTTDVLNRFESLPFSLEVELGGFELSVRELLALKLGTVLQTNHPASAPLTLRAGGTPVATGEIVLVEDALSVRVKEILGSSVRIEKS